MCKRVSQGVHESKPSLVLFPITYEFVSGRALIPTGKVVGPLYDETQKQRVHRVQDL